MSAVDVLAVLTPAEIEELRAVQNGADVWGYANAMLLRSVEAKAPKLIRIVAAMQKVPGHMRQPYFGCIATKAGIAALARCKGDTK